MTDTANYTPPIDQICWQIRAEDYSVRAANWQRSEIAGRYSLLLLPNPTVYSSSGVESRVAEWPATPAEWRSRLKEGPAPKETFVPKTELGRKLWGLRQKYIATGGRLYTDTEIADELERRTFGHD